jgi:hypothetical protein
MKGRVYDPGVGRFLSPDPVVAQPHSGQSWNPYSYVVNSPLNLVDPSGFQQEPPPILPIRVEQGVDANGGLYVHLTYPPRDPPRPPRPVEGTREAAEVGVQTSPFNVSTTGSAAGYVPQPVTTAPLDGGPRDTAPHKAPAPGYAWTGDKLNPVTLEGRIGRALLGAEKPVEPWTPPAAVAVVRAGMHVIPGLNSALVLSDPRASTFQKVFAVTTDVLSVVGVGVVLKVGRAGVAAARGTADIAARVKQVHGALHPIAQAQRTTAVLRTSGGNIVAGGARDLAPIQKAMLGPGEIAAKLPGAHAEITALTHAQQGGLTPQAMAVSRAICPQCAAAIKASGGTITTPTTAIWP